jgi:putative DNA methylase
MREPQLAARWQAISPKDRAEAFFMRGMGEALTAMRKAATDGEPMAIYYAFKQAEAGEDGVMSAGWASFLQAVIDAGLVVDGTWPIRTELANRMIGSGTNALASSIVLVCRKRDPSAVTVERDIFVRALRRELPDALAQIRAGGVGPVDMAQAAIGPGMGVFTRYAAVLEDSGEPMKVRTALAVINQTRDEIDTEGDASYDLETRFALDWFSETGWEPNESGRAILAANARNLSLAGLIHTGLITTQGGKTRLIRRDEIPTNHDPAFDKAPIVWKVAQHLARALTAEDGGQDKAAAIMAHLTGRESIRALAYRLYGLSERKNWAAEALVWNRVAEEWRAIEDRAATMPRAAVSETDLFGEAR